MVAFPNSSCQKAATLPLNLKRTLVVDDSATILHALCSLLEHHKIVDVVGRASSGVDAVDSIQLLKPDLLLMDADMPGMSGLRASLVISQLHPDVRIILMSMDTGLRFVQACLDCGAEAVVYKPRFLQQLAGILKAEAVAIQEPTVALKGAAGTI